MKPLACILLLLSFNAFAQKSNVFSIDSLPTVGTSRDNREGVLLDKGWTFHAGDNPDWAKPQFDDSAWEGIDPTKDIMDLPQIQDGKIGWLRLQIKMDSSLLPQPLALAIIQAVASEIYIDGQLIEKFGELHKTASKALYTGYPTIYTPISLPKNKANVTLAVRFAFQKGLPYNRYANGANYLFNTTILPINSIVKSNDYIKRQIMFCFSKVGAFTLLFILHIAFFAFFPLQKANLYFSGMALFFAIHNFSWGAFLVFYPIENLDFLMYFGMIRVPIYTIAYILLARAFYAMFNFKTDFIFWLIFGGNILICLANYFDYYDGVQVSEFRTIVLNIIASLYITIKAVLTKKRNAQIVFTGLLFSILGLTIRYLIDYYGLFPGNKFTFFTHACDFVGQICIPISISWFLGSNFAFTSKVLEKKLEEVQLLSEEKQQILAAQNETLEAQVEARTAELVNTQNQLIQSEKLASLGELTASIAHEIQNPLNFVNNFSDLSLDLVKDLKLEMERSPLTPEGGIIISSKDKRYIDEIFGDLTSNQERINHHGKRASGIVKGMLEHSRASTGVRELTDINKLADEYLRLSYRRFKAKNKGFDANFTTDFERNLPKIEVIPQDLERVLLNLINNAFYAVNERAKAPRPPEGETYVPTVIVSTHLLAPPLGAGGAQIIIKVKDNGTGMPESVKAKIFQPFFTTKPTGSGTGLGLSLAYDIVTKGHGGTLEVESTEGVGTEFIITLPK
jgi:two-component system, NtrC family, sensor kinase